MSDTVSMSNGEWREHKLDELGLLQRGKSKHRPRYAFHLYVGKYPFIQTGEVREARKFINSYEKTYSDEGLAQSKLWPKGTLCITIAANIAELGILSFDACFPDSVLGFIADKKKCDLDFIYYTLTHFQRELKHIGEGSVQDNINLGTFQNVLFPMPPLPEQKAIAEVLSSLDDKIDLLHRQNKTLEQMAETLFRQWFVEEAQEDWEEVKIGDFVKTNDNSANKDYSHQIIQYLDTGSLTEGKVEALQEFSFNEAPSRAKRLVQYNDVLISTVRPNQKHYGIVKNPIENLVVSTGFCVISCEDIDPHFIYILLTTSDMTEYLHSIAEGSTSAYPSLKPKDIEAIEFQLPPDELLQEFAEYCKNVWDKIDKNQTQVRTLESLRDTLLPKIMSGKIRVACDKEANFA